MSHIPTSEFIEILIKNANLNLSNTNEMPDSYNAAIDPFHIEFILKFHVYFDIYHSWEEATHIQNAFDRSIRINSKSIFCWNLRWSENWFIPFMVRIGNCECIKSTSWRYKNKYTLRKCHRMLSLVLPIEKKNT